MLLLRIFTYVNTHKYTISISVNNNEGQPTRDKDNINCRKVWLAVLLVQITSFYCRGAPMVRTSSLPDLQVVCTVSRAQKGITCIVIPSGATFDQEPLKCEGLRI